MNEKQKKWLIFVVVVAIVLFFISAIFLDPQLSAKREKFKSVGGGGSWCCFRALDCCDDGPLPEPEIK